MYLYLYLVLLLWLVLLWGCEGAVKGMRILVRWLWCMLYASDIAGPYQDHIEEVRDSNGTQMYYDTQA